MGLYDRRFCPLYGAQGRPEPCDRDCGFYNKQEGLCSIENIARRLERLIEIEENRDKEERSRVHNG